MKKLKKSLSLLLALAMCLSCMSVGAFATDGENVIHVASAEELRAAEPIATGKTVIMDANITLEAIKHSGYDYGENKQGIVITGGTLDGNGHTLSLTGSGDTKTIVTTGGTIRNLTIDSGFRGVSIWVPTTDVVLDNVTLDTGCYGLNTSETGNTPVNLIVTNSTIKGWSSYAGNFSSVRFTKCIFDKDTHGYGYNYLRPYVATTLEECKFLNDSRAFQIDAAPTGGSYNYTVTLKSCVTSSNGTETPITGENYKSIVDGADGRTKVDSDFPGAACDKGTTFIALSYVAQIGEIKYETLTAALEAATDGNTIKLLTDITVGPDDVASGKDHFFEITKNLTIDGNGKTITAEYANAYTSKVWYLFEFVDGENNVLNWTLKDLTINSTGIQAAVMVNSDSASTLNASGLTITTDGECLYDNGPAKTVMTNCVLNHAGYYRPDRTTGINRTYFSAVMVGYSGQVELHDCTVTTTDNGITTFPTGSTISLYNTSVTVDNSKIAKHVDETSAIWAAVTSGYTHELAVSSLINVYSGSRINGTVRATNTDSAKSSKVIAYEGSLFSEDIAAYAETNTDRCGVFAAQNCEIVANTALATKDVYPYTVGSNTFVGYTDTEIEDELSTDDAVEVTPTDDAVQGGVDTGKTYVAYKDTDDNIVKTSLTVEVVSTENTADASVTFEDDAIADALVNAANTVDNKPSKSEVKVADLVKANTLTGSDNEIKLGMSLTLTKQAANRVTFDIHPTVQVNNGAVETLDNGYIAASGMTVKMPVPSTWTSVKVYHGSDLVGTYAPVKDNGVSYVEFKGTSFSEYSGENNSANAFEARISSLQGFFGDINYMTIKLRYGDDEQLPTGYTVKLWLEGGNADGTDRELPEKSGTEWYTYDYTTYSTSYSAGAYLFKVKLYAKYLDAKIYVQVLNASGEAVDVRSYPVNGTSTVSTYVGHSMLDYIGVMKHDNPSDNRYSTLYDAMDNYSNAVKLFSN